MSMSGIGISDDLKNTLTDFKLNKLDGTEYLLVKLSEDKKQVVVEKKGPKRPDDEPFTYASLGSAKWYFVLEGKGHARQTPHYTDIVAEFCIVFGFRSPTWTKDDLRIN
ncbi:hypothetical protein KP79_PYT06191 [Mizuhopecten yessoensis]|uniref:Uncharacterized protein n=1 Tax=Mizuhopecten yessoensis TaxID=6573 RepID=A0A210QGQ3_MIZYE|nr:hypothetical protein KP79_PYT06191 [Mizuhopecten yessoensis]